MLQKLKWWPPPETHSRTHTHTHTHTSTQTQAPGQLRNDQDHTNSDGLQTYGTNQGVQFRVTDLLATLISAGE
jgi:hypothetical protein